MAKSRRLAALDREIDILREQFLPRPFDPLGNYSDTVRVLSHTRAFLVLSHAEVESYLEDWAKDIARKSEKIWTSSGRVTAPLAYLIGTIGERVPVSNYLAKKDTHTAFSQNIKKVFQAFYTQVRDNNGVKEKHVLTLFSPLGVPPTAYSSTLLPELDTLGALRGDHAHRTRAVQQHLDPETEYNRVSKVVAELGQLDAWLCKYRQQIR